MEIEFNNLRLRLNDENQTSSVIRSPKATGDVFIPRFAEYEGKKYKIISIEALSFSGNKINSLTFPEDSIMIIFEHQSLQSCELTKLQIPSSLKYLQQGWCIFIKNLVEIEVSPKNKYFSYINNEYLVGKSDRKSEDFDILHLANFNIVNAKIPPQIKEIARYSFSCHEKLETVEFPTNSKLKKIHSETFYGSSLKKLILPASIEEIEPLTHVNQLDYIEVSPKNRYFKYVNDCFLIKTIENKTTLIFSRRNLKEAVIPSYINEIYQNAFSHSKLTSISFEENSCLEKICHRAFNIIPGSSSLTIPKSVKIIESQAFTFNHNLKSIEILSETIKIGHSCFFNCKNLSKISFPNAIDIEFEKDVIDDINKTAKIYIRKDCKFHSEGPKQYINKIMYIDEEEDYDNDYDYDNKNNKDDNESILMSHIRFLENRLQKYEEVIPFDIKTFKSNKNKNSYFVKNKTNKNSNKDLQQEQEIKEMKEKYEKLEENLKEANEIISEKDEENELLKEYLKALKEKTKEIQFLKQEDYLEEGILGEGSTSNVKIVSQKERNRYAKKELKELSMNELKRFVSEGEILYRLRHPSIIRIIGINYGNKTYPPSIFLPVEPTSLEKSIEKNELDSGQKNRIAVELVLGMRYIHRQKYMHRDLKPSNILLSKNNHVRISDFGLAKEETNTITRQTKNIGTLLFMDPELFEDNEYEEEDEDEYEYDSDDDERKSKNKNKRKQKRKRSHYTNKIDVYSFGIVLIFIVTGRYPKFNMKNVLNGKTPRLPNTIASWVENLILKCLSQRAEDRPSFNKIFNIMKKNNFNLFKDKDNDKMSKKERNNKHEIEKRIMKIKAFEYQQQEC